MVGNKQGTKGFTIVELLIVIVVIAVLAAIVSSTYSGVQAKARDSVRKSDIAAITKALELYYADNGVYPGSPGQTGGSTTINPGWSTTADASWQNFVNSLEPYMGQVPSDPISTPGASVLNSASSGYNYAYFASATNYCGAAAFKMYMLAYRLEGENQSNTIIGSCSVYVVNNYAGASNYRVVKL